MEKININNLDNNILPIEGELEGVLELERIPIPEGLEERLSAKIDEWEKIGESEERRVKSEESVPSPHANRFMLKRRKAFLLAASFILVCGIGLYFALAPTNKGTIDTYDDPQLACQEAERALNLLAANLNKGLEHYEQAINRNQLIMHYAL